jgi:hypothetical protein
MARGNMANFKGKHRPPFGSKARQLHDSRGDTYRPGDKTDSAGDRIMGNRDSRGDKLSARTKLAQKRASKR